MKERVVLSVRLAPELHKALAEMARVGHRTINAQVVMLIEQAIVSAKEQQ